MSSPIDSVKTDRLREVERDALAIAVELGHGFVSTEHMLLAIARSKGVGGIMLKSVGLDYLQLRTTMEKLLAQDT